MKKLILAAFALTAAAGIFAQGTVTFLSAIGGGVATSHVWAPSSTAPWLSLQGNGINDTPVGSNNYAAAGMSLIGANGSGGRYGSSTTFAQLLFANGANQPLDSLQPGGQTTTFSSGGANGILAGRVVMITDTIPGLTPDEAAATFQMVAWDNSSGQFSTWTQASVALLAGLIYAGWSTPFTVPNIGGSINTPPNVLAPSFNLFLLPEPSTFALAGLGLAALMIARRRKYSRRR